MTGANKILTVSYGTFSCTLEKFDDPFSMMKAIAEYFRDLAAEDRYFGAEPPTPDAEMLHRIAEREIQRRVDAKINGNGVVLRAADLAPDASRLPPPREPEPEAANPVPVAENIAEAASLAESSASGDMTDDSVAAKLSRIRIAVAQAGGVAFAPAMEYVEDDQPIGSVTTEVPVEPLPAEAEPADEPLAEAECPAVMKDELAPAAEPEAAAVIDEKSAAEPPEPQGDLNAGRELWDDTLMPVPGTPESAAESVAADEEPEEDLSGVLAELEPTGPGAEKTVDEPVLIAAGADQDVEGLLDAAATDTAVQASQTAAVSEPRERGRARVLRIRRLASDAVDTPPVVSEVVPDVALSAEDEADLMRELAEVEAESVAAGPGAPPQPAPSPATPHPVATVHQVHRPPTSPRGPLSKAEGDAAMSRLIAETNSKMGGPENRRRLSTIAHLKAAAAAVVAERRAGAAKPVNETEREDPYRDDLSRMVRAAPAQSGAGATRPTPLVLVSEQRVDRPVEPARPEAGLMRSHRGAGLAAAVLEDEEDDPEIEDSLLGDSRGFVEFAERLGAQGLPALLEAAAAYTACVEGRPHFSRPQLLRKIDTLKGRVSREDSLRSFGALLRDGKIVKVRRGQYALAESSHLLVEARRMAG